MIVSDSLLADMKRLVRELVDDLRRSASTDHDTARVVETEYDRAKGAGRTALSKIEWAEGLFAQVAVAWVLGAVFVRFCEDNELIPEALLSGPDRRRDLAIAQRTAYFQEHPDRDDRDWCREIFTQLRALPATGDVFGNHNPVWLLAPSADGAHRLVRQFQQIDPDTGEVRHDFCDPAWDTRFLGDLYQDLSDHAKKTYALLQTPVFVEEFILDRTLEPALETFGLRDTTLIDPACGSGHFLLGAFARLLERWCDNEPATNRSELAKRALDAIAGVDLNPFAASIARFRLLVAAMRSAGEKRLADAPAYPIHVAVGDSLLHGDPPGTLPGTTVADEVAAAAAHGYAIEDRAKARALLSRSWSAVVGNPPYITVKDPALNALYRTRFNTCHRQYSLGVPFTEQFFQLARHDVDPERCGYVGMITANSFMKREFGKKLVEQWMPRHDLTHVIDTSGAYIPGHGTPTVILFGRNRRPVRPTVRAVMGIRGEPSTPPEPAKGLVWSSIVELVDEPGASSDYVSVVDLDRSRLAKHPWSIGGGGAAELKESLDRTGSMRLEAAIADCGRTVHTGEDAVFVSRRTALRTRGWLSTAVPLIGGENVRDWRLAPRMYSVFVYDRDSGVARNLPKSSLSNHFWAYRTPLRNRLNFGQTYLFSGVRHSFEPRAYRGEFRRVPLLRAVTTPRPTSWHRRCVRCGSWSSPRVPVSAS